MRKYFPALALLLFCSTPAFAWNCPSGQHRVQAPAGTPTTAPFYDVVEGIAFICESNTPPPDPTTGNQNQTQSQNQSQNSSSNSNSTSNSKANSSSTSNATGGNSTSTATGGSATATGGSSELKNSGNSTLTNSGNSSNTNSASGNTTSFSSSYQDVRQTPMAYAPDAAFTTSPCIKGFSAGLSFPGGAGTGGFSKTDKGCDSRQTAVVFHGIGNDLAAAKVLCSTDAAKRANLTLADCTAIVRPLPPIVVAPAPQPVAAPPTINVIIPAPVAVAAPVTIPVAVVQPKPVLHATRVCKTSVKLLNLGSCTIGSTTCGPLLDRAVTALASDNSSKIVLTGPVDSGKVVAYLRKRVPADRIVIKLTDDQSVLTVQTETGE